MKRFLSLLLLAGLMASTSVAQAGPGDPPGEVPPPPPALLTDVNINRSSLTKQTVGDTITYSVSIAASNGTTNKTYHWKTHFSMLTASGSVEVEEFVTDREGPDVAPGQTIEHTFTYSVPLAQDNRTFYVHSMLYEGTDVPAAFDLEAFPDGTSQALPANDFFVNILQSISKVIDHGDDYTAKIWVAIANPSTQTAQGMVRVFNSGSENPEDALGNASISAEPGNTTKYKLVTINFHHEGWVGGVFPVKANLQAGTIYSDDREEVQRVEE